MFKPITIFVTSKFAPFKNKLYIAQYSKYSSELFKYWVNTIEFFFV